MQTRSMCSTKAGEQYRLYERISNSTAEKRKRLTCWTHPVAPLELLQAELWKDPTKSKTRCREGVVFIRWWNKPLPARRLRFPPKEWQVVVGWTPNSLCACWGVTLRIKAKETSSYFLKKLELRLINVYLEIAALLPSSNLNVNIVRENNLVCE